MITQNLEKNVIQLFKTLTVFLDRMAAAREREVELRAIALEAELTGRRQDDEATQDFAAKVRAQSTTATPPQDGLAPGVRVFITDGSQRGRVGTLVHPYDEQHWNVSVNMDGLTTMLFIIHALHLRIVDDEAFSQVISESATP